MEKLNAVQVFKNAINSPVTESEYLRNLKRFGKYFKIENWNKYITEDPENIHDQLVYYINFQKKRDIKNKTIKGWINAIILFLEMNRVIVYKTILKKMLPEDDTPQGGMEPFTTEDVRNMLVVSDKLRTKALIHFWASTGARPAGIVDPVLKIKHLSKEKLGCHSVKIYDGSKEGYYAFLTPEASKSLNDYLNSRKRNGEKLSDDSPIFTNNSDTHGTKGEPISVKTVKEVMYRILKKAAVERKKVGKRYDKAAVYGFRKRFNGILKINNDINSNIAEKLMAHKRGLDGVYLRPTKEQCFKEFEKAMPDLTIDSTERDKLAIEEQQQKITELSKKDDKILELAKKLEEYQKRDLDDKDIVRIAEQFQKKRPELVRTIELAYAEAHKKSRIAFNEEMKRDHGLTDKDLEEYEVWKKQRLKKIKAEEQKKKALS